MDILDNLTPLGGTIFSNSGMKPTFTWAKPTMSNPVLPININFLKTISMYMSVGVRNLTRIFTFKKILITQRLPTEQICATIQDPI